LSLELVHFLAQRFTGALLIAGISGPNKQGDKPDHRDYNKARKSRNLHDFLLLKTWG
jgi:hypothetical protein